MSTRDQPDWWKNVGGQNSQDSILERRSLVWNDADPQPPPAAPPLSTPDTYKGKFYTRGCRGMIEEIQIYRTATAGGTITLRLSPHPCLGPFYTVIIPIGPADAWTGVAFEQMWNYDSLFIWVSALAAGEEWGYDAVQPQDGHESTDAGATWADMATRPFIRVVYTGETPGDVPVSGIVNNIPIPSSAAQVARAIVANVPSGIWTNLCTYNGAGEVLELKIDYATVVVPAAGVQYAIMPLIDGAGTIETENRQITQSVVATSGRCSMGEFLQDGTGTRIWVRIPYQFRRVITLQGWQNTGAAVTMTGTIMANIMR